MEWLLDPLTLVVVVGLTGLAVVLGSVRGYSTLAVVLLAVGVAVSLVGLRWASVLGQEALPAALLTGLGATFWTLATERGRRVREPLPGSGS